MGWRDRAKPVGAKPAGGSWRDRARKVEAPDAGITPEQQTELEARKAELDETMPLDRLEAAVTKETNALPPVPKRAEKPWYDQMVEQTGVAGPLGEWLLKKAGRAADAAKVGAANSASLGMLPEVLASEDAMDAVTGPRGDESVTNVTTAVNRVKSLGRRGVEFGKRLLEDPADTVKTAASAYFPAQDDVNTAAGKLNEAEPVGSLVGNVWGAGLGGGAMAGPSLVGKGAATGAAQAFGNSSAEPVRRLIEGSPAEAAGDVVALGQDTGLGALLGVAGAKAPGLTGTVLAGKAAAGVNLDGSPMTKSQRIQEGAAGVLGMVGGAAAKGGEISRGRSLAKLDEAAVKPKLKAESARIGAESAKNRVAKVEETVAGAAESNKARLQKLEGDRSAAIRAHADRALANEHKRLGNQNKLFREEVLRQVKEELAKKSAESKKSSEVTKLQQQKAALENEIAALDQSDLGKLGREYQSDYQAEHIFDVPDEKLSPEALTRRQLLRDRKVDVANRRLTEPLPEERVAAERTKKQSAAEARRAELDKLLAEAEARSVEDYLPLDTKDPVAVLGPDRVKNIGLKYDLVPDADDLSKDFVWDSLKSSQKPKGEGPRDHTKTEAGAPGRKSTYVKADPIPLKPDPRLDSINRQILELEARMERGPSPVMQKQLRLLKEKAANMEAKAQLAAKEATPEHLMTEGRKKLWSTGILKNVVYEPEARAAAWDVPAKARHLRGPVSSLSEQERRLLMEWLADQEGKRR